MPSNTLCALKLRSVPVTEYDPVCWPDRLPVSTSVLIIAGLSGGLWLLIIRGAMWVGS